MKVFKINEQQMQTIANILGEFPAKQVINGIDILRNLKEEEDNVEMISEEI